MTTKIGVDEGVENSVGMNVNTYNEINAVFIDESPELTEEGVKTLLGLGMLPDMAEQIVAEAQRRWGHKPGDGYSETAQSIKQAKAELKRLRRSTKGCL